MAGRRRHGRRRGPPHRTARCYLHCYAPTTSGDFAQWAGSAKSDAKERWAAVAGALVSARGDTKGFVLEEDLQALDDPPTSTGVRVLPAKDAFLQARDRDVLFPDPANRKAAFPILGGPGVVLREALPVATWRGVAKGRRYEVTVTPFARLANAVWAEIEAEAERVARVRGHDSAAVTRTR